MLPDYPQIKNQFGKAIKEFLKHTNQPPLSEIGKKTMFEGNELVIIVDGQVLETPMQEISSTIKIDLSDYENLSLEEVFTRIQGCAEEMESQKMKLFFDRMEQVTSQTGNKADVNGQLTPDIFLNLLEKMEISFDENGKYNQTFYGGATATEAMKNVLKTIEQSPELTSRHDEIIKNKRREWVDRESSRKLVG